jgi:tetratricopeptide (TPR) repeat protein
MSAGTRFFRNVLWIWALLPLAAGCAGLEARQQPIAEVAQKRRQRSTEVVQEFESTRDFAELQAATAHWYQGNVEGCEKRLKRLLERNPDHRDARLLMVAVCLSENRTQEALHQGEQALQSHPDDAQVQFTAGVALDAARQGDCALAYYARAVELEPDNEVYTVGYETALRAAESPGPFAEGLGQTASDSRSSAGSPERPEDSSQVWQGPPPVIPEPTAQAAQPVRLVVVRRSSRARAVDETEEVPLPSTAAPRGSGAETSDRVDPTGSAEAAATAQVRSALDKGREALAEGEAETALTQFRKAAALRPNNLQIPIVAAMSALRHNRPKLAVELLRGAERRSSDSAQLYCILGVAYYRLGDYRSSQVALRQALSLDKSSGLSYFLMGCTLAKLGQGESAEVHFRQARIINPRYAVRR